MKQNSTGIGGHHSAKSKTVDWITPPEIITVLGTFDLDPCACIPQPWPCARQSFTIKENGLLQQWSGRVWLNPPYTMILPWMKRISEHGNGTALTFARTDTVFFQKYIFPFAHSILWMNKRIHFYTPSGTRAKDNGGAPTVLIAYGEENSDLLASSKIIGAHRPNGTIPLIVVGVSPTWKCVITIALNRNGGQADLKTIYDLVERIAKDKTSNNNFFKEKVRQTLQMHFTRVRKGYYSSASTNVD